jgi:hypothetical protein
MEKKNLPFFFPKILFDNINNKYGFKIILQPEIESQCKFLINLSKNNFFEEILYLLLTNNSEKKWDERIKNKSDINYIKNYISNCCSILGFDVEFSGRDFFPTTIQFSNFYFSIVIEIRKHHFLNYLNYFFSNKNIILIGQGINQDLKNIETKYLNKEIKNTVCDLTNFEFRGKEDIKALPLNYFGKKVNLEKVIKLKFENYESKEHYFNDIIKYSCQDSYIAYVYLRNEFQQIEKNEKKKNLENEKELVVINIKKNELDLDDIDLKFFNWTKENVDFINNKIKNNVNQKNNVNNDNKNIYDQNNNYQKNEINIENEKNELNNKQKNELNKNIENYNENEKINNKRKFENENKEHKNIDDDEKEDIDDDEKVIKKQKKNSNLPKIIFNERKNIKKKENLIYINKEVYNKNKEIDDILKKLKNKK